MSEINKVPLYLSNKTVNTGPTFAEEIEVQDLQIAGEENSNRCIQCIRSFRSAERLENHLRTHEYNGVFKCTICDKTFTRLDTLTRHSILHSPNIQMFPCAECGKLFNRKYNMAAHMNIHLGIVNITKLYLCEYCGMQFKASSLTVHIRRHMGEKPYKCSTCDKGFPRLPELKLHERVHTGAKPYDCKICSKAFTTSSKLSRHFRVHTGEKSHSCMFCEKRFTQPYDLNLHMRIHTGEKPYFCGDCPKRFKELSQLKTHKRRTGHTTETKPDLIGSYRVRSVATTSGEIGQFKQNNNYVNQINNSDRVEEEQPVLVNSN